MYYHILDQKRAALLPKLASFKEAFYLAGGTGLAFHLGHRTSIDFDFFGEQNFDTSRLFLDLKDILSGFDLKKIQEEKNTLTFLADGIQISFFTYPYDLLESPIVEPYLRIASVLDIGCMKLSAIVGRPSMKDYVDLHFILKTRSLSDLLAAVKKKMPDIDIQLILKSLVYFNDIEPEKLNFLPDHQVTFEEVQKDLVEKTKKVVK